MDTATFSTADVDGYAVDGIFLARLLERLQNIVLKHGAQHMRTSVEIAIGDGPYGSVKRKHEDASPLLDGTYPQQPQKLTMMIYGSAPAGDGTTSFVVTVDLDRSRGGFLMTQGPAALATETFETIRGAMAAAQKLSLEPPRMLPMSPETTARFTTMRRKLIVKEILDAMRFVVPAALAIGLFCWGLFGPRRDAAWSLFMSSAMTLFWLSQFTGYPERRNERRRKAIEAARSQGLPPPIAEAGPRRSIDLSTPEAGSPDMRLVHEPLVPLSI